MNHQSRLRLGRVSLPGQPYHIINTAHERHLLFAAPEVARCVIGEMRRMHEEGWLHSHAWVLMPDHLHWLFTLGERADLSATMNHFKSGSAHAARQRSRALTMVWQTGFFDHGVHSEEDLRAIARYIVANPLRAGLCQNVGDYPWWVSAPPPNGSESDDANAEPPKPSARTPISTRTNAKKPARHSFNVVAGQDPQASS